MSTRVRQLIFASVSLSFVLGLGWILLYSSGYNFNWTQLAFQPTGGIHLQVEPANDVLIIILPNGLTSRAAHATFTHLLPGQYHVSVEAPDHLPVNLTITVEPNKTTVIEPLYLWSNQTLQRVTQPTRLPKTLAKTELPIAFQSILAQYAAPDSLDYYLVSPRQLVVLDSATQIVMEYTRDGSVMTSQQLGSAIRHMALSQNTLLLVSEFSLAVIDLSDHTTETITRLSTPIQQAAWLVGTPYIAYISGTNLHIIDSRVQTNYLDQIVTTTEQVITELVFDDDEKYLQLTVGDAVYTWSVEANK